MEKIEDQLKLSINALKSLLYRINELLKNDVSLMKSWTKLNDTVQLFYRRPIVVLQFHLQTPY